ncbi:hypothetical protein BUALT_Bualt14G0056500 [Buddleja alternifolia]|uniref:Uncharacterized protein n=1 Tax=Buddleja alternifolia TaxID=168488 RepID=A0AAV6WS67_9LAMI|nr:hypothetical protein BUALT_Bualt14G0056500 [Buddleja alternifolia]
MADAAVEFLLENLKQLIVYHLKESFVLDKDVIVKIKQVQQNLELLQSHLNDAPAGDDRIYLERETREMAYRFENVKETFTITAASRGGFFKRFVCAQLTDLRLIFREVGDIDRKIDSLNETRQWFSSRAAVVEEQERTGSEYPTPRYIPEECLVGREEDMELLRSYITDQDTQSRVITIFGMGGIGKTVLTMRLYHDRRVRQQFNGVAWIYVGKRFQTSRILKDLCEQLDPQHEEGIRSDMNEDHLIRRLYKIQQKRKCLIFLDDVWSSNALQILSSAFLSRETGSRIVITSRVKEVAETSEVVSSTRHIHKMRCLTEDEGYELVMKSYGSEFEVNSTVSERAKEMVKCFEGLPLAIINFEDFMRIYRDEWESVPRSIESFVSESQKSRGIEMTLKILASSYDNLPPFLKPCFLYLGYLHEHSHIDAEKLYLYWVAEGLISLEDCGEEEILMNVAERYLHDLEQRSMIEVHEEEVPTITRFSSCRLNRLMLEVSLIKSKEQRFFNALDFGCESSQANQSLGQYPIRLTINLDKYKIGYDFPVKGSEKLVMCLLLSAQENQLGLVWPKELSRLVKFKNLRVLDFIGFSFEATKLPKGLGALVFLRYLSFRGCILPELPSSIGKLKLLYVLDLRVINKMIIPDVLSKLKKLKHLYFPLSFETQGAGKLRLDGLTDLETVTNLNTKMFNVEDLSKLHKLRYIALKIQGCLEDIECTIKRMNANSDVLLLRASLEVRDFDCYTEERHSVFRQLLSCQSLIVFCIEGHISRLPLHNEISPNLAKIVLIGSKLIDDPMKILEKLPKLRVLVLKNDASIGKEVICSATGFVELKRLELLNLQYLEKWTVEEGAMPKLSILAIVNCGKLIMLPKELEFVCRLQQLKVSQMCKAFEDNLQIVEGLMRHKGQHMPSITFED